MIQQLKQFEKVWNEFVEWMDKNYQGISDEPIEDEITLKLLHILLIEFLDSKGMYVMSYPEWLWNDVIWCYGLRRRDRLPIQEKRFDTRTEATESGIIKAFELLNKEK